MKRHGQVKRGHHKESAVSHCVDDAGLKSRGVVSEGLDVVFSSSHADVPSKTAVADWASIALVSRQDSSVPSALWP